MIFLHAYTHGGLWFILNYSLIQSTFEECKKFDLLSFNFGICMVNIVVQNDKHFMILACLIVTMSVSFVQNIQSINVPNVDLVL